MRVFIAALALFLALPSQADAHCVYHRWYVRRVCSPDWNFTCHDHWVRRCIRWVDDDDYWHRNDPRPERVYAYERREEGPRCRPVITATGHEAYGRTVAKEEGEQAWMEEVRGRWGARYMDPRNAIELTYECYRSATGNRLSEKSADNLGKVLEQCRIQAIPCRAPLERADSNKAELGEKPDVDESRNLREDDQRRSRLFRKFQEWRRKHPR